MKALQCPACGAASDLKPVELDHIKCTACGNIFKPEVYPTANLCIDCLDDSDDDGIALLVPIDECDEDWDIDYNNN